MARRFSPEFNQEARKIVKGFNQRVRRAEARGAQNLPQTTSMRELKARFETESDLKKELSYLRQMTNNKEALGRHFLGQGSVTNWEFNYIKDNLEDLQTFYDVQIKLARARYKANPYDYGLRQQVITFEERREFLNRDINKLNYSELKTFRKYLTNYKDYNRRDMNYFSSFLKALDEMMGQAGVDKKLVEDFKKRINKIPPKLFIEIYRNHDVVNDIFEEIYKYLEKLGKAKHNMQAEDKLSPEDRAGYEATQEMFQKKFGNKRGYKTKKDEKIARDHIESLIRGVGDKVNMWEVEAIAGLHNVKDMEKMTPKERKMYDNWINR